MAWRDDLPEDLRDDPAIADIPDVITLAKSYRDGQQQIGRLSQDAIRRPSDDASADDIKAAIEKVQKRWPELMLKPDETDPDQWSQVMKSLGHPDDYNQYEIKGIDEEAAKANEALLEQLKQLGHKAKLTKRQYKELAGLMVEQNIEAKNAVEESLKADRQKLSDEWGPAYERNVNAVKALIEKTDAPSALAENLTNGTASPDTLRWLYGLAKAMGGEASEIHRQTGDSLMISPQEARELIDDIMRNNEHDFHHPERGDAHKRAKQKMLELYKIKQGRDFQAKAIFGVGL